MIDGAGHDDAPGQSDDVATASAHLEAELAPNSSLDCDELATYAAARFAIGQTHSGGSRAPDDDLTG